MCVDFSHLAAERLILLLESVHLVRELRLVLQVLLLMLLELMLVLANSPRCAHTWEGAMRVRTTSYALVETQLHAVIRRPTPETLAWSRAGEFESWSLIWGKKVVHHFTA